LGSDEERREVVDGVLFKEIDRLRLAIFVDLKVLFAERGDGLVVAVVTTTSTATARALALRTTPESAVAYWFGRRERRRRREEARTVED